MTDPRLILDLYGETPDASGSVPQLPWQNSPSMPPPAMSSPQNLAQKLQELLGAKEPDQGGMAQDILSSRFGTSYGDYANGVVQSAMGKPTLGPAVASSRISDQLKQINDITAAQKNMAIAKTGGSQGATMAIAQALMDQGIDPVTAISFAKSGIGSGMTMQNGKMVPITGAPEAKGAMEYGKQTGGNQSDLEYKPMIAQKQAYSTEVGKQQGEVASDLNAAQAAMPQLEQAVQTLSDLGKKATYTTAGRAANTLVRETGMGATEGAQARAAYIAHVKNNVLPLLRRTFGAQFTKAEGDSLLATLGDPNSSPQEKDATLRAFIEDKKATLGTMQRQAGQSTGLDATDPRIAKAKAAGYSDEEIQQYLQGGQ